MLSHQIQDEQEEREASQDGAGGWEEREQSSRLNVYMQSWYGGMG